MAESYKLNWGLWMEATPFAVLRGVAFQGQRGILLEEFGNHSVRIVREGLVVPGWYARSFWQPLDEKKRLKWDTVPLEGENK